MNGARVICLDIESSPALGWCWQKYETNILKFEKEWELLSFAWKELGKKQVHCIARPYYKDTTDKSLTKDVWEILNYADVVIAHNGDKFDVPKLRAKFLEHGLPPPKPFKTIDTRKIAKAHFLFNSNSLNDLAALLKMGAKKETGGIDLWFGCMLGDTKAWRKMIAYNKHDVVLLEKVYERLKPWHPSHPNLALHADLPPTACPVCASQRVQRRGYQVMQTRKAARLHCQGCGHWFSRSIAGGA